MESDKKEMSKEEKMVAVLMKKGYHIAFAESCTGGMAAARLINVASASSVINESIVTYANEAKIKYLHVEPELIEAHGVVSEEVAGAMAKGMAAAAGSEVGVGISGIAGPSGATPGKPVKQFGELGRNNVRQAAVEFVYDELLEHLTEC